MNNILDYDLEQLQAVMADRGEKPFRAKQIYEWLHVKLVTDFKEMTNISAKLQQEMAQAYEIQTLKMLRKQVSKQDGTTKFLWELSDGNTIESVWLPYHHGNSVCISTQVGCRMGCGFCASTVGGLVRSLRVSEMLAQIYEIQRITGERVSHIIAMGMGEPFDNYENVVHFIRMITDEKGLHISARNITVSTCGLVPQIYRFAKENLSVTLALSLHAPTDELRSSMMPVAKKYSLEEIMKACREYVMQTGRRVTFEYSMVDGINDTVEHAKQLCSLIKGINCHVNLIPLNPVKGRMGARSVQGHVEAFKTVLEKNHIQVTVRREMGSDIDAACGQLRQKEIH